MVGGVKLSENWGAEQVFDDPLRRSVQIKSRGAFSS